MTVPQALQKLYSDFQVGGCFDQRWTAAFFIRIGTVSQSFTMYMQNCVSKQDESGFQAALSSLKVRNNGLFQRFLIPASRDSTYVRFRYAHVYHLKLSNNIDIMLRYPCRLSWPSSPRFHLVWKRVQVPKRNGFWHVRVFIYVQSSFDCPWWFICMHVYRKTSSYWLYIKHMQGMCMKLLCSSQAVWETMLVSTVISHCSSHTT
jgi:hypothetical protein